MAQCVTNWNETTRNSSPDLSFRVKCRVADLITLLSRTLLSRTEGKTLEFKCDLSSPDGALKAIVAFTNPSRGVLVLGVEDGTKKIKGIPNKLAEEERLANLIADSIYPRLVPFIEVMPWRKTQVLAVEIYPSANRPHYLNRLGAEEGVFCSCGFDQPAGGSGPDRRDVLYFSLVFPCFYRYSRHNQ